MTYTLSFTSILFLIIFYYSFLKRNLFFEEKWTILKKYFFLGFPLYFLFWDILIGFKISIGLIFLMNILNHFILKHQRVIQVSHFISMLGVITAVNYYLDQGISHESYVAVSYCFAAFFISFFDIVMNFKNQIFMKIIFMILANLLIFQVVYSAIRMGL